MKRVDLIGLMSAYNFELQDDDVKQCRMRFRNHTSFIDIWNGQQGMTIGVYNPETKKMWYRRRMDMSKLEDTLIEANNYQDHATVP